MRKARPVLPKHTKLIRAILAKKDVSYRSVIRHLIAGGVPKEECPTDAQVARYMAEHKIKKGPPHKNVRPAESSIPQETLDEIKRLATKRRLGYVAIHKRLRNSGYNGVPKPLALRVIIDNNGWFPKSGETRNAHSVEAEEALKEMYDPQLAPRLIAWANSHEPFTDVPCSTTDKNGNTREFMKRMANPCPNLELYARKIGLSYPKLAKLAAVYPDIQEAIDIFNEVRKNILMVNGLNGDYAPYFTTFVMVNILGWSSTNTKVDHTSNGKTIGVFEAMTPDERRRHIEENNKLLAFRTKTGTSDG